MDFVELSEICHKNVLALNRTRSPLSLFREQYSGPTEAEQVWMFLKKLDFSMRSNEHENFDEKVRCWLMDLKPARVSPAELLMYRLRFENAAFMLDVLSSPYGKMQAPAIHLPQAQLEEALSWALVWLWQAGGREWLYRTSKAFCRGLPSALVE